MLKHLFSAWRRRPPAAPAADPARRAHDLFDAGEHAAALDVYEALFARTGDARHLVNGGYCALMLGDLDAARTRFGQARGLDPALAQAWIGAGDVAARQHEHAQAVACYDRALALDAQSAIARNNRSLALMALGRWEESWRDAEARFLAPGATALYPHQVDLPLWDGQSRARLLVHWEQGLGDIVQHLRFLPEAARRAGHCSFECPPPLLSVATSLGGQVQLVAATDRAPDPRSFDCFAPLLSLPFLLGCTLATLPQPPYLQAPLGRAAQVASHGPRIGLVWRASKFDTRRNMPLDVLLAQAGRALPDAQFVSLQKDVAPAEAALLQAHGCIEAGSGFADFGDTAAAIVALDAVVTVDTSVAHVCGALAHPTVLVLNSNPAERWGLAGDASPWYPSTRLVRRAHDEPEADWIARGLGRLPELMAPGAGRRAG